MIFGFNIVQLNNTEHNFEQSTEILKNKDINVESNGRGHKLRRCGQVLLEWVVRGRFYKALTDEGVLGRLINEGIERALV